MECAQGGQKSEYIITVSHFEKNRIKSFFGFPEDDKRLVAIYNGVSEHFVKITDLSELNRVKEKYQLPDNYAFFLGNTDPKKIPGMCSKPFLTT